MNDEREAYLKHLLQYLHDHPEASQPEMVKALHLTPDKVADKLRGAMGLTAPWGWWADRHRVVIEVPQ